MKLPQADTTWFSHQFLWTFICFGLHVLLSYKLFMPSIIRRKQLKRHDLRGFAHRIHEAEDTINELKAEIKHLHDYEASEKESILFDLQDESNQRWIKTLSENQALLAQEKSMALSEMENYTIGLDEFASDSKAITDAILKKFGSGNA